MGFFDRMKEGLKKTRNGFTEQVNQVLRSFTKVDEDLLEELLELLIMADVGMETAENIIDRLREEVKTNRIAEPEQVKSALGGILSEMLSQNAASLDLSGKPAVVLVIGVNGVGKTTTIGKLAAQLTAEGKKVALVAADTFRAAAIDQLAIWAERAGVDLIRHQEGADPSAVVFDGIAAAKARGYDVLVCDTAGRLHNKKNLMDELKKINRIIERELPQSSRETLLVLDATTGQNAVSQAKLFSEAAEISGLVLTKLDGTAKGGVVLAIGDQQQIPVKYIGVGEQIDDLQPFEPQLFVKALLDEE
ncbi:MAG: signal recognition particle-docking protein FtsY [Clostridia bacterium]|nr:signal recognition particle-docking protein FtsY [Clostridia bacterium]